MQYIYVIIDARRTIPGKVHLLFACGHNMQMLRTEPAPFACGTCREQAFKFDKVQAVFTVSLVSLYLSTGNTCEEVCADCWVPAVRESITTRRLQ